MFKNRRKSIIVAACCVLIVMCGAAGTIAWLATSSDPVVNTFTPAQVSCYVEETFNGTTKSYVKILNTSNIDAYIRVKLVATFKDASGNVYAKTPVAGTDYALTLATDTGWFYNSTDGFYYYKNKVAADTDTGILINSCIATTRTDGLTFDLQILAEAIQAAPSTAVTSWGVTVNSDGTLSQGGN